MFVVLRPPVGVFTGFTGFAGAEPQPVETVVCEAGFFTGFFMTVFLAGDEPQPVDTVLCAAGFFAGAEPQPEETTLCVTWLFPAILVMGIPPQRQ